MKLITKIILLSLIFVGGKLYSQILFSEPFTSNLGQMTAANGSSANWVWSNSCTQSSSAGHSAPGHALFQGSGCQFGNGGNTVSGNLSSPQIAIGPSGAVLTFNYFLTTECGQAQSTCFYDVLTLQISNNGGTTFTDIMSSDGTPSGLWHTNAWTPVTYNLTNYINQNIIIRFNFNSIDGAVNAYDGVYVDDIIVTGNCSINAFATNGTNSITPSLCSGNSMTLTTNAVSNYSWSNGATTPSIVVSPTANTVYSVSATSSMNCVSSSVVSVTVYNGVPQLTVANTASASGGICPSRTVNLNATGAVTYTWVGGSSTVTNGVTFSPTTTAGYTVTGANACGTSTAATSVSIHPYPTVSGTVSQPTICSGLTASLIATGNATAYVWQPGNIPNNTAFFPQSTTQYTAIGTSALGCTQTAFVTLTVVTTPIQQPIASPPLICIGNSATLTSVGASGYTWNATGGGVFNTATIAVSPTVTSTYTITRSNANCTSVQTVTVIVNQLPSVFAIASPSLICANRTTTLQGGGAQTFTWTAPGPPSFTMAGASPVVSPSVTTIYSVAASDGTCVNTTTVQVSTDPNPTITISSPTMVCQGDNVVLNASGATGYTWTTPAGTVTGNTISESPTNSFLYQVIGINNFNCTTVANQVMVVQPTPTLNVTTNKPLVCSGAASNLTVTGATTYSWDANAGNSTSNVVQVNPVTTTVYTVNGFFSTGCTSKKTITVTVFEPVFSVNNPTSSCLGGTVNLIASGALTYTWNGNQPFSQVAVSPTVPTVYSVAATSSSLGVNCVSAQNVTVTIYSNPTITAVAQKTLICKNESTNLIAGGGSTYLWSNSLPGGTVTVSPQVQTVYQVIGTDQNGCVGTQTVMVKVSTCFGIEENNGAQIISLFPNPNNGTFMIRSEKDMDLLITNQLGQFIRAIKITAYRDQQVDLTEFNNGIYFITGNGIKEKVIVSR